MASFATAPMSALPSEMWTPTAATDGEWVSNGELPFSEFETVDYPYQYGSPYAVLELNRWALDGKALILPGSGTVQDGFASSRMSDAEGSVQHSGSHYPAVLYSPHLPRSDADF